MTSKATGLKESSLVKKFRFSETQIIGILKEH